MTGIAETATPLPCPRRWLVRLPEVFAPLSAEIIARLDGGKATRLSGEYAIISLAGPEVLRREDAGMFVQWNLPLEHSWPCHPQGMEGFIEKAAQAMARKFADRCPQTVLIGPLDPSAPHRYYRTLASNLRGRALQVFPKIQPLPPEEQDPAAETLFCLVGKEGLFCGMQSPAAANGFYPGGTKFISQGTADTISRAGAKIAEALHYFRLWLPELPAASHWLEIGASPGGMTSELLARGHRVTAVDRAPLDRRLLGRPGLTAVVADAAEFAPPAGVRYDALLSDLNGDARESLRLVIRLSRFLKPGGLVVFTMKTPGSETVPAIIDLFHAVRDAAAASGLDLIARTHLTYNRQEFTLFLRKT